jgi:type IV pilus assembly protein PilA
MNCPYCAEPIADDSRFCPKCGTQMGSPLPDSPLYRQPVPPGFRAPTSGKAIGSFICSLFFFFFPASVAAVILGHLSLGEIRRSAGRLKGQGLATVGLVLGYLGIAAIPLILIIAAIAIPNLIRSKMAANEASAVRAVRQYVIAATTYSVQCESIGFPRSVENLGPGKGDCERSNADLAPELAIPHAVQHGYIFDYTPGPTDPKGHIRSYTITAEPLKPGNTGQRHLFADERGVIRFEMSATAGPIQRRSERSKCLSSKMECSLLRADSPSPASVAASSGCGESVPSLP